MGKSFRFIVMADCSKESTWMNSDVLQTLLSNIKDLEKGPEFIFFVGDMIYGGTNVANQLEAWKALVSHYFPIYLFYTALGNHEDSETAFSNAFPHLPNEQLKGYQRTVYYFDNEDCRFIVLNSNRRGSNGGYAVRAEQRDWLESLLRSSTKKYNFIFLHVPVFPVGQHYGESLDSSPTDRNALWAILDRYNVTAVFTGHEHNYNRRIINSNMKSLSKLSLKNRIYQITAGGAGTSLNARITENENIVMGPLGIHHYVIVDVSEQRVTLQSIDRENSMIDSCFLYPILKESPDDNLDEIIIPLGARWSYLDNGSDQGASWRELDFDDSVWRSGLAELGYGDGGETTVVSYGPNSARKYITTYFRKSFDIKDPSVYKELTMRIQRDDGAVVYLNGKEVYRTNMPEDSIYYNTLASKALNGADEISYQKTKVDPSFLRNGYNVIAVEIHQASASSSDISFNLQMVAHKKTSIPPVYKEEITI